MNMLKIRTVDMDLGNWGKATEGHTKNEEYECTEMWADGSCSLCLYSNWNKECQ